ncbi:MAG TPA: thioredoxin domain-containing protein [Verrucomicrobiae bacterium]|nr:thioredoxin domain-containing protein [Verrucomicrobiae bacterium]
MPRKPKTQSESAKENKELEEFVIPTSDHALSDDDFENIQPRRSNILVRTLTPLNSVLAIILALTVYNTYRIESGYSNNNLQNTGIVQGEGQNYDYGELVKSIGKDAPFQGNPDAELIVVELGDYQCPFCKRYQDTVYPELKQRYIDSGKIKFVYLQIPFLGNESYLASNAAKCAQEQNKFWEYHEHLYANQGGENSGAFNVDKLKGFAKDIDLNTSQFNKCLDDKKYSEQIDNEKILASKYNIRETPTTIVGEMMTAGAYPPETFISQIDSRLK